MATVAGNHMKEFCPKCNQPFSIGDWFECPHGRPGPFYTGDAAIHTSERAVVYEHPATGKISVPGRVDQPMHPKMAAAGYVRKELTSPDIRKMESIGLIHEASNYDRGSAGPERDTGANPTQVDRV